MSELVPEGWTFQPIGDYVEKMVGGAPLKPSDFSTAGHRVIPKKAVQFGGKIKFDVETYCSSDFAENNIKNVVDSQYLITTLRDLVPSGPTIGVIGVLEEKGPFVLAQGVYGLKTNNISDEYLAQVSNTSWYRNEMRKVFVGSTQVHIRNQEFLDVKVPFPPLPEQKKIAAILTSVDDVIEKTQAQIDKLKDLKTAMMQELLTRGVGVDGKPHTEFKDSPVGKIPKGWEVVTLSSLTTKIGDGIHSTPKYIDKSAFPFINGNNLKEGKVVIGANTKHVSYDEFLKHSKNLSDSTILMSINGTIGNLAYYQNEPVVLGKSAAFISVKNDISKEFIYYALGSDTVKEFYGLELTGSTIRNLSLKAIRSTPIALPTKKEQDKIANVLISLDTKLEQLKEQVSQKNLLKKALMQDLLTGKVRVKVDS